MGVRGFVLRRGAHGYKLSVWWGDARLYVTDRVDDTLDGTPHAGQGMGVLLQLGPKWLQQYGKPYADNILREHVTGMLMLFGLRKPIDYPIRINRLDAALDLKGLDITTFSLDEWQRGWVGFAKVADFHNDRRTGRFSGLDIGARSGNVSLIIYDKVLEAKRKGTLGFWRSVWTALLGSPFGDHGVGGKSNSHPHDIRQKLLELEGRKARVYPKSDLVPVRRTLAQVLGDER